MSGTAPVAAATVWQAPPEWRAIEFLSDLHLSDATPRTFAALRAHLASTRADAVVILGDLFEAWVGDDARLDGFEAQATAMLADAARQRTLAFMAGNRDFLVGARMLEACGLIGLSDPTVLSAFGRRVLLTHGDALCLDDVEYQRFREQVRSAPWQQQFLALPLARRREIAAGMRRVSQEQQTARPVETWGDLDADAVLQWLRAADAPVMIHGHTHRPARHGLGEGFERIVLSDWDHDMPGTPRGDVLRLSAAGLERIAPLADPTA